MSRAPGFALTLALSTLLLVASFLLSRAAKNDELFGDYYTALIVVSVAGIGLLAILTALQVWRLIRQFRARTLGSRLTLRFVGTFTILTLVPLAVVYYFAVQFLSRSIDSWFDLQIEQTLDDAMLLGRSTLETIKLDVVHRARQDARRIEEADSAFQLFSLLDQLREKAGFEEMSLHSATGRILASSSSVAISLVPDAPNEHVLRKIRRGETYAEFEPVTEGGLRLRVAVQVPGRTVSQPMHVLQILHNLPVRYSRLGESVESASAEYEKLKYLREPLAFSFVLTLTLVSIMTLLIALLAAIYLAQRLLAPLRDLAEGTRAVAQGDYRKQLPVNSGDELGVLVSSFNQMTREISSAQQAARHSQQVAEAEHAYLDTVLTHLSAGVLSFDHDRRLRTHNPAAGRILHTELSRFEGAEIENIRATLPATEPLLNAIGDGMRHHAREWQREIDITGKDGRQTLILSGSRLSGEGEGEGHEPGYVVVFEDATELLKAQRDAAWGEVARRLAHEIKNPLTPIQLSAERIRRKYLGEVGSAGREALDRSTRTIVQQVEAMKAMVNAFSEYARPAPLRPALLDINQLISDTVELFHREGQSTRIAMDLDPELPRIRADRNALRQVLNNLIINAQEALADNPAKMRFSTRRVSGNKAVEICLQDNGPGFPEKLIDNIFEPYVTGKEKGSGLGLAISRRIIEEHGGSIRVNNLPAGGATVIITLSLRQEIGPTRPPDTRES